MAHLLNALRAWIESKQAPWRGAAAEVVREKCPEQGQVEILPLPLASYRWEWWQR